MQDTFILVSLIFKGISAILIIVAAALGIKAISASEKAENVKDSADDRTPQSNDSHD